METNEKQTITVSVAVNASIETVWNYWNSPKAIVEWYIATETWHTPKAEIDLKAGGAFSYRMEAKDGSFGFDFCGVFDIIVEHSLIEITLGDNRKVKITFESKGIDTIVTEVFEAEKVNPIEMQQLGWQTILNSFKKYVELK